MIGEIVADVEALDVAVLGELLEEILVEVLEVVLDLAGIHGGLLGLGARRGEHVRPLVHVGEEEGGADAGPGVQPGATIPVPARPDLEVEGAVHPVLLRPEDRRQVLRHPPISFLVCYSLPSLLS